MNSQTIAFEDKCPCILDTSVMYASKSKLNFLQKGGKKKTKGITKQFMFLLLKLTTYLKEPEANSNEKCFLKLKPYIANEFKYNKINGEKGLRLLCRHMGELKKAFPNMNLSVTHFRDTDKRSIVIILMVLGVMKGSWLNKPATNKYERLGIVFHILTNKNKDKITEINFKSEYIPEDCYKKIRALDLLHTAFAINKSAEEAKRTNGNVKQAKSVEGPLILVQTNNRIDDKKNEDFRRKQQEEIFQREKEEEAFRREVEAAEANAEALLFGPNKNAKELEEKIAEENVIPDNEPGNNSTRMEEVEENEENEEVEDEEPEYQNNSNAYYEEVVEEEEEENTDNDELSEGEMELSMNILLDEALQLNTNNWQNRVSQGGGDGYYTAVEQIPIAGRPVIQGYKSCCKPYFKTSGNEFDNMCQIGGALNDAGNHIALRSKTLLMVKNGVIYSITASVIDSIGENTADVMGMKGKEREKIKEHMKKHMHNHTHNIVKEMINNGTPALSSVIPSNDSQIAFIPVRMGGKSKRCQSGGNFIGTLGTLLFPAGNTMENIVPWLLTLGSVLFKRIEKDVYNVSKKIGRKKVKTTKKVTKRVLKPKKTKVKRKTSKNTSKKTTKRKPKKTPKKITGKPSKKKVTKIKKKDVTIRTRKKWEPLTNTNVRRLMHQGQLGGECGSGLCGDASLRFFEGCKRPEWGVGAKKPMCI